jgi:hypothetical protein
MNIKNIKNYQFVYTDVASGQDKELWVQADGYAHAHDKFWSNLNKEDITNVEVEVHTLKEWYDGVYGWS